MAGHRWSRARLSVRTKVSLVATATGAVLMAGCMLGFNLIMHATANDSVHSQGLTALQSVVRQVEAGTLTKPLPISVPGYFMLQVVDTSNNVLAASPALVGVPPILQISHEAPPTTRPTGSVVTLPGNGGDFYMIKVRTPSRWGPVDVFAVTPITDDAAAEAALRRLVIGLVPPLVLLLGLIIWWSVGRALRPVAVIGDELAAINGRALSQRVTVPASEDEISRLATAVNATLDRLELFVDRQRKFVSDASHELRSPLTGLLTRLDVAVADPEHEDWPSLAAGALADAERLSRIMTDLLRLARLDSSTGPPRKGRPVDLAEVAAEEAARPRRLPVDLELTPDVVVLGDRESLRRVIANLLDNAARHGASRIRLSVAWERDEAVVEVIDDGAGIDPADRRRIFQRFVRLSESRKRDKGGTGLGLAIAQEIAIAHRGTLRVEDSPDGWGARFVMRLKSTD
ncbi:MAG: HAMP domain-containing sensor histidine kinase [Streptosporangiaceae bacterium]